MEPSAVLVNVWGGGQSCPLSLLGEKIIDKTSFAVSIPLKLEKTSGLMRVDGFIQGEIHGKIIGEMHGFVQGDASLFVKMGKMEIKEEDESQLSFLKDNEKSDR